MSRRTGAEHTVTAADVRAARERFDDDTVVQRTPVDTSRAISELVDADVSLKMEHLQRTGSFKTRGAYNKLSRLDGPAPGTPPGPPQGEAVQQDRTVVAVELPFRPPPADGHRAPRRVLLHSNRSQPVGSGPFGRHGHAERGRRTGSRMRLQKCRCHGVEWRRFALLNGFRPGRPDWGGGVVPGGEWIPVRPVGRAGRREHRHT